MACLWGEKWGEACISSIQLAPGRIWFLFICHSQGVILHPRLLSPRRPWQLQAASSRKKKKKRKKTSQSSTMNAFGRRRKWHIVCAQTWIDAALHSILINREKQSNMFILCYSRVFLGLVCKVLLILIVILTITFCYALEDQCKQSHA